MIKEIETTKLKTIHELEKLNQQQLADLRKVYMRMLIASERVSLERSEFIATLENIDAVAA